jgi:D-alanyl-D-alanine carboxypeptidase (penicillin-binding protein 5/6)
MFMKKVRLFCLMLALVLAMGCAAPVVLAAPEETTVPPETSVPMETDPPMPEGYLGDASVEYGCRTLDAKRALADTRDYSAQAKAALVYDLSSDTLLFAQDVDVQLFPASLTKVMTCLLTLEMQQDLDAMVTVTKAGLQGMEPGGSNASLKVDERISVRDLLYCLMVSSANDAASVLAVHNSGSIEAFVEVMNRRAEEIGCTGTHFMNPHGLHHEEHYTTARDMAKILREAMQKPLFEEIFSTQEHTVPATNLSEERHLKTTNFMIRSSGYPVVLDSRVIGGKTGYTSKAGRCFVALAQKNGMRVLTVVLGTKAVYQADGYSFVRYGNFEETSGLLNFAYNHYTSMQVLNPTQAAGQFAVSGGEHNAFGKFLRPMSSTVPKGSDFNTIRYEYTLTQQLTAPIRKGQTIGLVRVWYGDTCLAQQELLSASAVAVQKQAPVDTSRGDSVDTGSLVDGVLRIVLSVVAVVFVLLVVLRLRAASLRRRKRRRKSAAKAAKNVRRG